MNRLFGSMKIGARIAVIPFVAAVFIGALWVISWAGMSPRAVFWVSSVIAAMAVVISFLAAALVKKSIGSSLNKLKDGVTAVFDGNLTRRIDYSSKDEIGELGKAFNNFLDGLLATITDFATNGMRVSGTAFSLDQATKDMMSGFENAATQVNSVATASEEMSSTSTEIARNCVSAARTSEHATSTTVKGEEIITHTVSVMARISDIVKSSAKIIESLGSRSDQIGEVINLIDDIADQTNLLALNAAIEAARAGEHGRGFAVVADEVRKLAEKTSAATSQIGTTIKAMQTEAEQAVISMNKGVGEVEIGTEEAQKSGSALKDILKQINAVSSEVGQIAVASEQQTSTIDEIANNIHEISRAVEGTARNAERTSEAASQMAKISLALNRIASQYTLATRADLEELIKSAADYMRTHGKEKGLAEINNPQGLFVKKGMCVLAQDTQGTMLAHGLEKGYIGANLADAKDANGKLFVRETLEIAKTKGGGWVEVAYENQATKKIQPRLAHFSRVDDVVLVADINQ